MPQSSRIRSRGVAGMLKYIAKISMDIFPSVLATIIGAYIVNHYINAKPAADAPAAAPAATPDANDLVRAAIERLRKSPESKAAEAKSSDNKSSETKSPEKTQEPAVREAARTPEAPRVIPVDTSMVRPLPPPITVS